MSGLKVVYENSDDYMYEEVKVLRQDGTEVCSISTQADCPEDNSCSRLGVYEAFSKLIKERAYTSE